MDETALPLVALPGRIYVIDWVSTDDSASREMATSFGVIRRSGIIYQRERDIDARARNSALPGYGYGGWFGFAANGEVYHHTWADYLKHVCKDDDIDRERAEALRSSIVERRIWRGGSWHINSDVGVPQFSDVTVALFSRRSWGDLLAAVWSTQLGQSYRYLDFLGDAPKKPADFKACVARGVQ